MWEEGERTTGIIRTYVQPTRADTYSRITDIGDVRSRASTLLTEKTCERKVIRRDSFSAAFDKIYIREAAAAAKKCNTVSPC